MELSQQDVQHSSVEHLRTTITLMKSVRQQRINYSAKGLFISY